MKNIFNTIALFALMFICVIACQKTNEAVTDVSISELTQAKEQAAAMHNEYLDYVQSNFANSKGNADFTATSVKFFKKYYPTLDIDKSIADGKTFFSKNTTPQGINLSNISISTELTSSVKQIGDNIASASSVTEFKEKTDKILFSAQLNKEAKMTLAAIVGVAQGSYTYWTNAQNRQKWSSKLRFSQISDTKNNNLVLELRSCPGCNVITADVAGAAAGGIVLGSICSAVAALEYL
jgi:hypothetical protein